MEWKSERYIICKSEIKGLKDPHGIINLGRTNRVTDRACPNGGRKAVYPADTRMLCKRYVKHTVLTSLGRIDLERSRSGAEKLRSNCPKKYCAEHAKHASKVNLNTDKCNHHDTKLQNNILLQSMLSHFDGKGSKGQN